ncbi:hypothetical protein [Gordonia hydrophobica]|uniref:Antitoxin VbhA domain-containing protein n=1 Tax=Gordonia hydrophobica TaxID=40516 RepID=A0ABZ2TZQ1_9ACTN|nr:hypothetical protein [Gordonia hydrophobica]MBM7369426.1 hypothetical protein [Gordonia hydrophobica]
MLPATTYTEDSTSEGNSMTEKRFLTAQERRDRIAALPAERHIASASAAATMAGMPLTDDDVDALHRLANGTTTFADERDRILSEIRQSHAPIKERRAE